MEVGNLNLGISPGVVATKPRPFSVISCPVIVGTSSLLLTSAEVFRLYSVKPKSEYHSAQILQIVILRFGILSQCHLGDCLCPMCLKSAIPTCVPKSLRSCPEEVEHMRR